MEQVPTLGERRPRGTGYYFWRSLWFALMVAAAAGAYLVPRSPTTLDLASFAVVLLALGVFVAGYPSGELNVLRNPSGGAEPEKSDGALTVLVAILLVIVGLGGLITMLVMSGIDLPPNHRDPEPTGPVVNASTITAVLAGAQLFFLLLQNRVGDNDATRVMRLLSSAKELGLSPNAGDLVRVTGVVKDPTPIAVEKQPAAFALTTDEEHVPGSDPNIVVKKLETVSTFLVEGRGFVLEVDPRGAYWSGPSRQTMKGRAPSGNNRTFTIDYLPVGSHVVVAGRLRGSAMAGTLGLASDAGAPLAIVRVAPGFDPVPGFRSALRWRNVAFVVLALITAAAAPLGYQLMQELPPTHVPDSDGD